MTNRKQESQEMTQKTPAKKKKNKLLIIIIIVALIVIVGLSTVIYYLLNKKDNKPTPGGKGTVITESNVNDVVEGMTKVADNYYQAKMNTDWTFSTSSTASEDAYVENSSNNTRTVYFIVQLEDTNEIVYTSPDLPLGSYLKGFALDEKVDAGNHKAIVTYHLIDDKRNEITTVSVSVTLHILN